FGVGSAQAGQTVPRQLTVHVTDEDGLAADATRTVQVHVTDMSDDDTSPLCRAKPWMCDDA
ncbi:MAG: hypothetical protein M3P23_09185, partial [Actinomycetota bacterium]|nr:hypothetical protein [Actinomycetota bacterium]